MKIGIHDKHHSRNEIRGYPTTKKTTAGMSIATQTGGGGNGEKRREERGQKNGDDLREERGEAERKRQGRK